MLAHAGVDIFKVDRNGQVAELRVMLRPLRPTMLIAEAMKRRMVALLEENKRQQLTRGAGGGGGGSGDLSRL